jgi:hypothetical protein
MKPRAVKSFIPFYPNNLPTVPKPSRASRTASLVFSDLPASQHAITRLLNRCRGQNSYRAFESPLSATAYFANKNAAICVVLLPLPNYHLFTLIHSITLHGSPRFERAEHHMMP